MLAACEGMPARPSLPLSCPWLVQGLPSGKAAMLPAGQGVRTRRALAGLKSGTVALAIIANTGETTPFNLGDEVGFNLVSWAWPSGITGTARAIGLEWTDTTITPVLDVTGVEGIS